VEAPTALRITFDNHEVEVRPDEVLVRNGVRTLRRVKTGHAASVVKARTSAPRRSSLATRAAFPDAIVELVYLADAEAKPLVLSPKELSNRPGQAERHPARHPCRQLPGRGVRHDVPQLPGLLRVRCGAARTLKAF
jgi:hypothetical protein